MIPVRDGENGRVEGKPRASGDDPNPYLLMGCPFG